MTVWDYAAAIQRQISAYRAGADQVLADLRTIRRQLLDADLCITCKTKARVAIASLGPLIDQAATLRSTLGGTS